mgnify:CR=1 FL=1
MDLKLKGCIDLTVNAHESSLFDSSLIENLIYLLMVGVKDGRQDSQGELGRH